MSRTKAPVAQPAAPFLGWFGRGRGRVGLIDPAPEFRGTSMQVCGLFPFATGAGTPMVGVPFGRNILTGATLCCDPISWFERAKLIANPSVFVLGKPGLGKSSAVRRMVTGLAGYGTIPLILGDLKPDYVDLVEALGGQVISLARGRGHLNVLDPGAARTAADRLRQAGYAREADAVLADAHGRALNMVRSLITISRGVPPTDREVTILDRGLKLISDQPDVPVLGDLLVLIQQAPTELRAVALDRGDYARYREITEDLEASLLGLTGGGSLGEIFAHPTTNPMMMDRPVVYDVSGLDDNDTDLRAAVLMAAWSDGFAMVNIAQVLADVGLEPRRHYFVVMDEMWQALRAGKGIVNRIDAITRLNRQLGVGTAMITHTMSDLLALPSEEDQMKARGFVERAGMVICAGLPRAEMEALTAAIPMSMAEQDRLVSWQDPPDWDPHRNTSDTPPGVGKFLVKVGGRPGIPVEVVLTRAEHSVNDTNKRWGKK